MLANILKSRVIWQILVVGVGYSTMIMDYILIICIVVEWLCVNLILHVGPMMHFVNVKIIRMIDSNVSYGFLIDPIDILDAITGSLIKEGVFNCVVYLDQIFNSKIYDAMMVTC